MGLKQVIVGVYSFGYEDIELVLREGDGGEFYNCPGKGEIPRIKIGADSKQWRDILSIFLHEAFEFTFNRLGCRYSDSYDMGNDSASYLFVASHIKFSDACARVGEGIATALPDLSRAWVKWQKGEKHNATS